jgi:hypothetical protein
MKPKMAKRQRRTRRITTRYSDEEYARLVKYAVQANCRNISEYQRVAALTRKVSVVQPQDRRDMISALVDCTAAIERSPAGPVKDLAMQRALEVFERIVSS